MMFMFCTACPAAPFTRLSATEMATIVPVRLSNVADTSQKFVPATYSTCGRLPGSDG